MAQYRGRRAPKLSPDMERLYERLTTSYCPECGSKSVLCGGGEHLRNPQPGAQVSFACPNCGEFAVVRNEDGWSVRDDGTPYILNGQTDAATRLHRYDPSSYSDEEEARREKVLLMCQTAIEYISVGSKEKGVDLIREALGITVDALASGSKDIDGVYFGCINIFFESVMDGMVPTDETEEAVSEILDVSESLGRILTVGVLSMCSDALDAVGATPGDRFFEVYDKLKEIGPESDEEGQPFFSSTYWEGLALISVSLGRMEDALSMVSKAADAWQEEAKTTVPTSEDIDRVMLFVVTMFDNIEGDEFDDVLDIVLRITDSCGTGMPYMSDTIAMIRYEHRLQNGLHPFDRLDDLTALIAKYEEPANEVEASILVKSLAHRAQESEDLEDAVTDMDRALDVAIAAKLQNTDFMDLVMDVAVRYLDLVEDDKKLQRAALMKLRKIKITRDMVKAWKKKSRKE